MGGAVKLTSLIPFRDADQTRTPAKNWIVRRWAHFYPDAEIIEAPDDGIDPFNKSMAVNNAARLATGDVYAILDADTWIDPMFMAKGLHLLELGIKWVIPARRSLRLRKDVSQRIMALDPTGPLPPIRAADAEQAGPVVGFLWLVPRKGFEAIGGMDERIRGWGGEDTMFTWAMDRVVGPHRKLSGTVMSLWHARPRDSKRHRIWVGQDRSLEGAKEQLAKRYAKAFTRDAMLQVLRYEQGETLPLAAPHLYASAPQATMPRRVNWQDIRAERQRRAAQ